MLGNDAPIVNKFAEVHFKKCTQAPRCNRTEQARRLRYNGMSIATGCLMAAEDRCGPVPGKAA